jgi:hypothetical protein
MLPALFTIVACPCRAFLDGFISYGFLAGGVLLKPAPLAKSLAAHQRCRRIEFKLPGFNCQACRQSLHN